MTFYLLECPYSEEHTRRMELKDDNDAIEFGNILSRETGKIWFVYRFISDATGVKARDAELRNEAVGTVGESPPSNMGFSDEAAVAWFCECEHENMHFWALEQCPNCKKQRPKYTVTGAES